MLLKDDFLSLPERMTLESLSRGAKSKTELQMDLEIRDQMLALVLIQLIRKKLIKENKGLYQIDKESLLDWKNKKNISEGLRNELIELINACVSDCFQKKMNGRRIVDSHFSLKKIWVNETEKQKIDEAMEKLENLIGEISSKQLERSKEKRTIEQKIIYWGSAHYGEVFRYLMNNV